MRVVNTDAPTHQKKGPRRVPPRGGTGEEENVSGGLPPSASKLIPLFCLCGRAAGGEGDGYPEKGSQSPGHKVEAVLLKDVWIRQ